MGQEFWLNWLVQLAVAVGTIGASITALYLAFRQSEQPRLKLKVLRREGERTRTNSGEDIRFYHLQVWNERRSSSATRVQVHLLRLEEPGPDGNLQTTWLGDLPFRWRDQEFVPRFQKIGSSKDCDLCSVGRQSGLTLMPLFLPNSLNARRQGRCRLVLSFQARSNQADSEIIRISIAWDGIWEDGDTEMGRHCVVGALRDSQT
jgi:hypothetical protein